jgi:CRP-like cAMP-binding protein
LSDIREKVLDWLRAHSTDAGRTATAVALMIPDLGHAGELFAAREAEGNGWIGKMLAGCVDVVFYVGFREAGKVHAWGRRLYAVGVALMACIVNGAFNVAYYRDNAPGDPFWVSLVLGASAPVLASLLSVMQALRQAEEAQIEDVKEERDEERRYQLEKLRIEAEAHAQIEVEKEKTKQARAQARAEQAKTEAQQRQEEEERRQDDANLEQMLASLGKSGEVLAVFIDSPTLTHDEAADMLGITRQTVGYHLRKLEANGLIRRNGNGIEVLAPLPAVQDAHGTA